MFLGSVMLYSMARRTHSELRNIMVRIHHSTLDFFFIIIIIQEQN